MQRQIAHGQTQLIVVYRLLFGLRAATPFALGLGGVSPWRFSLIDIPIAAVWATGLVVGGWILGRSLAAAVERFGSTVMGGLAVIVVIALVYVIRRFVRARAPSER